MPTEGNDLITWTPAYAVAIVDGYGMLSGGAGSDLINLWAHYGDDEGTQGVTVNIRVVRADGAMIGTGTVQTNEAGDADTARFRGFEQGWTHQGNDTIDASGAEVRGDAGILRGARWGDDVLIGSDGHDTVSGFDAGVDALDLGGAEYNVEVTAEGALIALDTSDTILISVVFDFG